MKVTDPVCGMSIDSEKAKATETYQGTTYYFCCPHCQSAFRADAAKFAAQAHAAGAPHGAHHHHG
jgi:YHS domain-containing protein